MIVANKKIAIIGGGPGGLTLARLLQMKGVDVTVYERDVNKDARVQGATLDLHEESGLAAIKEAGLMDAFMANYRPGADLLRVTDEKALIAYDQHAELMADSQQEGEYFRPEIDRGPLRNILLGSLNEGTVVWDSQLKSIAAQGDKWILHFSSGSEAEADIVIGADGANSKLRQPVTDILPFYSGITVVEGNVYDAAINTPRLCELVKGGKVFALDGERSLILSAKGDGSLSFYTGCHMDEQWVKNGGVDFKGRASVKEWFLKEFENWDEVWGELFASDDVYFVARPQYCMPADQHWEAHANITLLGDAAHLMPPYAGEGVNMAMQDALELSRELTDTRHSTVHEAIAAYEQLMFARTSQVIETTMHNTHMLHSENALQNLLAVFNGVE